MVVVCRKRSAGLAWTATEEKEADRLQAQVWVYLLARSVDLIRRSDPAPRGISPKTQNCVRCACQTRQTQQPAAMLGTLIPTRFLTTLAHTLAILMIFSSKVRATE